MSSIKYLVSENDRQKIVDGEKLRAWIDHTKGEIKIRRLCGLNEPVELIMRWFGNGYLLTDRFGNNEGV